MTFDPDVPALKEEEVGPVIEEKIEENEIVLFVKGTEYMPQCGYSQTAINLVRHYRPDDNVAIVNVLDNLSVFRDELQKHSGWNTIPQVFVNEEFIGGADILKELNNNAELGERLNADDDVEQLDLSEPVTHSEDVSDGPF